ncbi:histidine kinase [Paraburkholderia sp. J63]|uniref:histidine kinase n=1 Tax=Paraburkholderia sp. J63 TaxID=2805434 RepID=UPI002ABE72D7|nr:histidine kinase [Paraburkholderia sp. J63]
MNAADRAWLRRYPLYAKTCIVLACLVALIALLFVCTRVQLDNKGLYEQATVSLGDAARLRRIATSIAAATPATAATLNAQATALVRNDTLLTHWRQRGAPTPLIATILQTLDSEHPAPDHLDALRAEIDRQGDALEAVITLLEACTAALLFAGIFSLAWGARRAMVLRPALPLHMLGQVGIQVPAGRDEIDRLITVLNALVARLRSEQDESARLKRIVEDHIAFADQSLDLLHYICAQLAEDAPTGGTLEALLQRLVGILRVQRIALVLSEPSAQLLGVDTIVAPADLAPHVVRERVVNELMSLSGVRSLPHSQSDELLTILAAPVRVPFGTYGVLIGESDAETRYEQRHLHLLETIASVLAQAISNLSRDVRDRRMTLLEERNAIARELHDSLAQSLSYMKIQLARLQAVLPDELSQSDVGQIARAIREGIDSAYRQLRELLTTFRTSVHARGLAATLEEAAEELSSRSEVQISIDNRIRRVRLTVNEELHIGQIVREALTNVVRHARASSALVTLSSNEREVTVTIEDDGRGIATESGGEHHYGLSIMRERSRSLGGRLEIRSNEPGSRIVVTFVPASFAQQTRAGSGGATR